MQAKLIALRGSLRASHGTDAVTEVNVNRRQFLIGSAPECNLCCPSKFISAKHCVLLLDDYRATVRDLHSEAGTFVNEQRVDGERVLVSGDRLRVGRLEFEVQLNRVAATVEKEVQRKVAETFDDGLDGDVSGWLERADAAERSERLRDPNARRFVVQSPHASEPDSTPEAEANEPAPVVKQTPRKLPRKQVLSSKDSTEGAEDALKRMFGRK